MASPLRLVVSYLLTVIVDVLVTMLVPELLSAQPAQAVDTSLTSPVVASPVVASPVAASPVVASPVVASPVVASPARAVSAPPVLWTRAVATRALVRGDTLHADDFAMADTAMRGRIPFGLDTTTPQAGWLVHRAVAAGEWLRAPAVQPRAAVSAGQTVQALWFDGDVSLAVTAIALNSAPIGGAVSLRVGRTRRLRGVAMAPDTVRIR